MHVDEGYHCQRATLVISRPRLVLSKAILLCSPTRACLLPEASIFSRPSCLRDQMPAYGFERARD